MKKSFGVITRHCRLLCPECRELKRVRNTPVTGNVVLVCGHAREELLRVSPGHVSIEHLRTEAGKRVFPISAHVREAKPHQELTN